MSIKEVNVEGETPEDIMNSPIVGTMKAMQSLFNGPGRKLVGVILIEQDLETGVPAAASFLDGNVNTELARRLTLQLAETADVQTTELTMPRIQVSLLYQEDEQQPEEPAPQAASPLIYLPPSEDYDARRVDRSRDGHAQGPEGPGRTQGDGDQGEGGSVRGESRPVVVSGLTLQPDASVVLYPGDRVTVSNDLPG